VWTAEPFGGVDLYGLDPRNGSVVRDLSWSSPASVHFATPASADGRLFIAAGNVVRAFVPPSPPPAPAWGGYLADGWGGVHQYGGAAWVATTDYWSNQDIARGITMRPDRASGYVLNAYGGLSGFGLAEPRNIETYWAGWDIARGIVTNPCDSSGNSGYVLDGWGGIHPYGGAPIVDITGYWPNWDIARAIAVNPCQNNTVTGYVLDGWGGLHVFWQHGSAAQQSPPSTGYWQNWDIARGLVVTARGQGMVLDGYGGLHPFGGARNGVLTGYWQGRDIARGITFAPSMSGGYTMDAYGGLHPWWLQGSPAVAYPSNPSYWSNWPIARALSE
jgi:hypothetical protein